MVNGGGSGVTVEVGDVVICATDDVSSGNQATVGSNWVIIQTNIDGAVTGPGSSTSGNLPSFSGTSGKVLADSGLSVDTDGTLAANSDSKIATQKAVKTYANGLLAANDAMVFKGVIDCSANPNYPAANCGDTYKVSVAGKIGGASGDNVEVGDLAICTTDNTSAGDKASVGSNWSIIQVNLDGAVSGPSSSVDSDIPVFNGTTGKILKSSGRALPPVIGTPSHDGATSTFYNVQPGWINTGVSTFTLVAGRRYYFPQYCRDKTSFDRMFAEIVTGTGIGSNKSLRFGILLCDEFYRPTSVLWDSGLYEADYVDVVPLFMNKTIHGRFLTSVWSDGAPTLRSLVGSFIAPQIGTSISSTPFVSARYAVTNNAMDTTNWTGYTQAASDFNPLVLRPSNLTP